MFLSLWSLLPLVHDTLSSGCVRGLLAHCRTRFPTPATHRSGPAVDRLDRFLYVVRLARHQVIGCMWAISQTDSWLFLARDLRLRHCCGRPHITKQDHATLTSSLSSQCCKELRAVPSQSCHPPLNIFKRRQLFKAKQCYFLTLIRVLEGLPGLGVWRA